jgi:hypothetical protein
LAIRLARRAHPLQNDMNQSPFGPYAPLPPPLPPTSGASRALKLTLLIGLPFVLLAVAGVGGFAYFIMSATAGPRDAAHAFLRDARRGDWDAAYDRTSSRYQGRVERVDLEAQLEEDLPDAAKSKDATFNNTSVSNGAACLAGTLSPGGSPIFVQLHEATSDKWVIDHIADEPSPACVNR